MAQQKVLFIGSGRRIQNTYWPAFKILQDQFSVVGIHSRTPQNCEKVAQELGIPAFTDFSKINFDQIDFVAISISTPDVVSVLKKLEPYSHKLSVLVDTPTVSKLTEIRHFTLFRKFKKTYVAEDYMNFPKYAFMRKCVKENFIGPVTHVHVQHGGYSYHGFSLIRSFFNFKKVFFAFSSRVPNQGFEGARMTHFYFGKNQTATMIDPYDYDNARMLIAGQTGLIADYTLNGTNVFKVIENESSQSPRFQLMDKDNKAVFSWTHSKQADVNKFAYKLKTPFYDQKILGLIDLLQPENTYDYKEGLYEHFLAKIIYRLGILFAPFSF